MKLEQLVVEDDVQAGVKLEQLVLKNGLEGLNLEQHVREVMAMVGEN